LTLAELNRRPQFQGLSRGDARGYTPSRHFFNPPRLLDVVEILQDFSKSLISNEKVVNLGAIFQFPASSTTFLSC
jgi:hypothetical protein